MRTYKPTYPARYTPRAAGEPAAPQISLAPLVPDQTPDVIPAAELYGRRATSVRALITDSRISGACRVTEFDGSGIPSYVKVVPPKSPYYSIRLHPEQSLACRRILGYEPGPLAAPMFCGSQPTDQSDPDARSALNSLGLLAAPRDPDVVGGRTDLTSLFRSM